MRYQAHVGSRSGDGRRPGKRAGGDECTALRRRWNQSLRLQKPPGTAILTYNPSERALSPCTCLTACTRQERNMEATPVDNALSGSWYATGGIFYSVFFYRVR